MNRTKLSTLLAATLAVLLSIATPPSARSQDGADQDDTRQIFFPYEKNRPKKAQTASAKKPTYKRKAPRQTPSPTKKPAPTPQPNAEAVVAGVTLWRLEPSKASDTAAVRMLVQEEEEDEGATPFTPVRVESDAPLRANDKVRITIESPRDGYLYVVDREVYADGTTSAPYLIFPTSRTRRGDNRVRAGLLVDIPAQEDRPSYFTLKPSRDDQKGELLTVIVSPKPLDVPPIGRSATKLSEELFAKWLAWEVDAERFEMEGGAGQSWTAAEQAAAAASATVDALLAAEDPLPQTIYRVRIKPETAMVFTVPLTYSR